MEKATVPSSPPPMTYESFRSEMVYRDNQIADLKKKIRLLVRILVEKKIIGEEIAKTFEESKMTPSESKDLIKWYEEKHKKKTE